MAGTAARISATQKHVTRFMSHLNHENHEWSGSLDPVEPDLYWVDDDTDERVNAKTGERTGKKWRTGQDINSSVKAKD